MQKVNYWIVGAMWGGKEDNLDEFLKRNYWYCWDKSFQHQEQSGSAGNSVESQQERFKKIKPGDRIAVKKMISMTKQEMEIRSLGIVKDVDLNEWRIYVNWLPLELNDKSSRIVPLKGCVASIHGSYESNDTWIRDIFYI